jgi:hypothetical protein
LPEASPLPVAITIAVATTTAFAALASTLRDVRQQRELSRALDGARDLALMTAAGTGDPA